MAKLSNLERNTLQQLRFKVTQSAADTFTEEEYVTPVSKSARIMMLIHEIRIFLDEKPDGAQVGDLYVIQVSKDSQAQIEDYYDDDILALFGITFTALTSGGNYFEQGIVVSFKKPIAYAKGKIFVGFNTNGQAAAKTISGYIGYTIENVATDDFIVAAVDD